ncbi:MAG TPA: hypothetical protein VFZ25_16780 [Chloroflexota bacterium]|nr:hypothetical protein [Chloroflexota bacterium]
MRIWPARATTNCHLGRAAFAGFVGGYLMALAGYWLQAVFGVSELNFAHNSLRYVSGGKQGWWIVGVVFHLIDSVLLGILYATVVYQRLHFLGNRLGRFPGGVAAGSVFATGVWLIMGMLIAMPFGGAGIFGRKTGSALPAVASYALHLIFGSFLGAIYESRVCSSDSRFRAGQ